MHEARNAFHHRTATYFGPRFKESSTPAIQVAGVLVTVYLDDKARLIISAEFDESEIGLGEKDVTPVIVKMSGETVWETS